MKKKLVSGLIFLIMLFAALPYSAGAADEDILKYTSSGNAFGGGDNLQIDQDIQGDLVLAGSRLEINGNIGDDFIGAGGELIVNGNVSGNIIAAGGSITGKRECRWRRGSIRRPDYSFPGQRGRRGCPAGRRGSNA